MDFKTYKFWDFIKELDWKNLCIDNELPYEKARVKLKEITGNNNLWIGEVRKVAVAYRKILQERLREYSLDMYGDRHVFPSVSKFSLWELTAHIVGCGKEEYDKVMENPELITKYLDSYKENFVYIFS